MSWTAENGVRVKLKFVKRFNLIWVVQSCSQKYSALRRPQISGFLVAIPAREGAYRDRHGRRAGDAMDAAASGAIIALTNDAAAYGEVVWFWRSDAGAKVVKTLSASHG